MPDISFHRQWHPIAASHDLPFRHVYHGQLLGREFAVWRADDGYVNIWENRCLHRGVRLSIGVNDGRELKCQYHGWRYANRSAGCTYIPAHPADAPARTICNRTYPSAERYGLVWSAEDPEADAPPQIDALEGKDALVLRGLPVDAPAELVVELLCRYRFEPNCGIGGDDAETVVDFRDGLAVALRSRTGSDETGVLFFVQPVDAARSVIRGMLDRTPGAAQRIAVLRHHNERLKALRADAERRSAAMPPPLPMVPLIAPLPAELAEMPDRSTAGREAALSVVVARKWVVAEGIAGFELSPLRGTLPSFQPGAHIDVHMPGGQVRQYSIVNAPGETANYTIAVKLEPDSTGGSRCMHQTVRQGDVLAISEPRNNFPLRRDAARTLLIAGGIGLTPLLSMAQALHHQGLEFTLHCFAQSDAHLAFPERLAPMADQVSRHLSLSPAETGAELQRLLAQHEPGWHIYICGPGPMLENARATAAVAGWPEEAVHFEYFKNTRQIDDRTSFEVALARSALTLTVPAGRTILEVLRENGVDLPSSCEQGACGTCMATVLEGEPDHQDVYLNDGEKARGTRIMTCVSRARSARLVLDI